MSTFVRYCQIRSVSKDLPAKVLAESSGAERWGGQSDTHRYLYLKDGTENWNRETTLSIMGGNSEYWHPTQKQKLLLCIIFFSLWINRTN